MIDKTQRKATVEQTGSMVVVRMTGGPDCLWLNMYLDTEAWQMTCDSDIGFYAYHWGKRTSRTENFEQFCCRWLADDEWLLRKCIGERHVQKQVDKAATKKALMTAYVDEHAANLDRDEYDDFLDAIALAEQADDGQTYSLVLSASEHYFNLPEDYYEYIEEEYTPWQKRFAEICREVIVPELRKLVDGNGTVEEFGKIVRGCNDVNRNYDCSRCPLCAVCGKGFIEQFVTACDVVSDDAKAVEEDHAEQ